MTQYSPTVVREGIKDFIAHRTGSAADSVEVLSEGFGYVVQVKPKQGLPEDVEEQLRLMLPEEYRLELIGA
jgi:hypothetical protein